MSSRWGRVRAGATALTVVLSIAVVVFLVIAAIALTVGFVWGAVFGGGGTPVGEPPDAAFEVEDANGAVTITHAGGDAIDATDVVIEVDEVSHGQWADHGGDEIDDGDSITIDDIEAGSDVRLQWVSEDGASVLHEEAV
ncbi:hypothetical protein [Halovivax sp.]|uniref:hypothetical protein n=1 Tax=Halovivax sp. TaxID=1935978 RepID=UPI0025BA0DB7|nr:hypothetical protein [Halovivax sp.]